MAAAVNDSIGDQFGDHQHRSVMDVAAYAPAVQSIASELSGCGDILDARR